MVVPVESLWEWHWLAFYSVSLSFSRWLELPWETDCHGDSNCRENGHFHGGSCRNRCEKWPFWSICRSSGRIGRTHLVDQFYANGHCHYGSYKSYHNHRNDFWVNDNTPGKFWLIEFARGTVILQNLHITILQILHNLNFINCTYYHYTNYTNYLHYTV